MVSFFHGVRGSGIPEIEERSSICCASWGRTGWRRCEGGIFSGLPFGHSPIQRVGAGGPTWVRRKRSQVTLSRRCSVASSGLLPGLGS